jgi:hypothetical protein
MGCELRMSPLSGSSSFRDPSSSSSTAQEQEHVKNDMKLFTTGIRILIRTSTGFRLRMWIRGSGS